MFYCRCTQSHYVSLFQHLRRWYIILENVGEIHSPFLRALSPWCCSKLDLRSSVVFWHVFFSLWPWPFLFVCLQLIDGGDTGIHSSVANYSLSIYWNEGVTGDLTSQSEFSSLAWLEMSQHDEIWTIDFVSGSFAHSLRKKSSSLWAGRGIFVLHWRYYKGQ
jgi:hypothetical protein